MTEEIVEYSGSAGRGSGAMVQSDLGSAAGVYALAAMDESEFNARLAALKTAQRRAATIQRELMVKDTDYGVIPGTGSKPTLLKPGAEKLATMFGLRADDIASDIVYGDGVAAPQISVTTRCPLKNPTGIVVAMGIGNCNSWESRYRWRTAQRACPKCGNVGTILRSKEDGGWFCWARKGGCGAKFRSGDKSIEGQALGKVENPDPYDLLNTILKMSLKRAYVDGCLRATATSGLFTQDVEDMPESFREEAVASSPMPPEAVREVVEGEVIGADDVPPAVKLRDEIMAIAKSTGKDESWLDASVGAQPPRGYGKVFAALDERELVDYLARMKKFAQKAQKGE